MWLWAALCFIAGGSDKVEIKHQNAQTEAVEIKDLRIDMTLSLLTHTSKVH